MLAKSAKYHFDGEAIRTETGGNEHDKRARVGRKTYPTALINGIRNTGYYQPVIQNCFNRYYEFEHDPEDGDCTLTLEFLHHIFGEQYELGLDYIQLLYQRPQQILPILCLVSAENNTGKSTFTRPNLIQPQKLSKKE